MTNQLLFGDIYTVKDTLKDWLLIETADDQFEGWLDKKQASELDTIEFENLKHGSRFYSIDFCSKLTALNQCFLLHIAMGSRLPHLHNDKIRANGLEFKFDGHYREANEKFNNQSIGAIAKIYLGSPYLWGGRSPFGIDCSGLVQIVFKMCGILLPRNASQQVDAGEMINFVNDAQTGDLAFFDNEENKIIHVGVFLNNHQIIHASGEVRIDSIDHQGIFNENTKKYTHHLRIIKRIVGQQ